MSRTLTSANSILTLVIPDVFVAPIQVQGFATDNAFDIGDSEPTYVTKGVDGKKSSGYTPFLVDMTIHLQADSTSIDLFDAWIAAMKAVQEDFTCSGSILVPSVQKVWTCTNGSLRRVNQVPGAKKTLEAQAYVITWDRIDVAPILS